MARRIPKQLANHSVVELLSTGKSIKGLKGWLRVPYVLAVDDYDEDSCSYVYLGIEIVGIAKKFDEHCGLAIEVKIPKPNVGPNCIVSPCAIYLTEEEIKLKEDNEKRLKDASRTYKQICQGWSVKTRRNSLLKIYDSLPLDSQTIVIEEAQGRGADMAVQKSLTDPIIKALATVVVKLAYNLTDDETSQHLSYY